MCNGMCVCVCVCVFSWKVLALVFIRKLLDFMFTKRELSWLDDLMPESKKKKLEDAEQEVTDYIKPSIAISDDPLHIPNIFDTCGIKYWALTVSLKWLKSFRFNGSLRASLLTVVYLSLVSFYNWPGGAEYFGRGGRSCASALGGTFQVWSNSVIQ